eukprot:225442-Pleurochrysis_carterae.AAC.2
MAVEKHGNKRGAFWRRERSRQSKDGEMGCVSRGWPSRTLRCPLMDRESIQVLQRNTSKCFIFMPTRMKRASDALPVAT